MKKQYFNRAIHNNQVPEILANSKQSLAANIYKDNIQR